MKRNKKGFTLIELLAVILILAIIALIAVPVVMNIITKSRKSAFEDTAYGIIKAGELYYADRLLEPDGMTEDKMFTFPDDTTGLDLKGSIPRDGSVIVTKEGKVAIGVTDGKYCVMKEFEDTDVTVTEDIENCRAMYINGIMSSKNQCIAKGEVCTPTADGIGVTVKVNDNQAYNFYVIKDDGKKVTLIMDRNLYEEGNTTEPDVVWYESFSDTSKGPITALTALQKRTSTWTNLPLMEISTFEDRDGIGKELGSEEPFTMYARLPKYNELSVFKDEEGYLPEYLFKNLYRTGDNNTTRYWTSRASSSTHAWFISYDGIINSGNAGQSGGLRPVIELAK